MSSINFLSYNVHLINSIQSHNVYNHADSITCYKINNCNLLLVMHCLDVVNN